MTEFSQILKAWYTKNKIEHPWKKDKDPYKIWVSEIILQQTRVSQGTPYYHAFLKAFPQLQHLSATSEERLFSVWEGLGYYRRASNMLKGARFIMDKHNGEFPRTYEELLAIPGIGPYTAAAIGSFAFDNPTAVVDGNVNRVISRLYNIDEDLSKSLGKQKILAQTQTLLEVYNDPAEFNQAIMDFGAHICTPKAHCTTCPATSICKALQLRKVEELPQKKSKKPKKQRNFHFAVVTKQNNEVLIDQRAQKGIWANMFQFPLIESKEKSITSKMFIEQMDLALDFEKVSKEYKQLLSHQQISAKFYHFKMHDIGQKTKYQWFSMEELNKLAFPRVIRKYIDQMNI